MQSEGLFLLGVILVFLLSSSGAALLPDNEVEALMEIAKTIGKTNWNFSVDPCSGNSGWAIPAADDVVSCDCSYVNFTICHVVSM
ncbi:hypothetical protein ACHQM5_018245 [Ranunculus cassubicifolius]